MEIKIGELVSLEAKLQSSILARNKNIRGETGEVEAAEKQIILLKGQMEALKTDPGKRSRVQEGVGLEHEVERLRKGVSDLETKTASLDQAVTDREEKWQALTGTIKKAGEALELLKTQKQPLGEAKPGDRPAAMKYQEEVYRLQAALDVLNLKKDELDALQTKIAAKQALSSDNAERLRKQEEQKLQTVTFYEECRLQKESAAKALEKNTAYLLSKNLQEGDPCPVCGSEHHPRPAVQIEGTEPALLEQRLAEAEKRLQAAEKAFKDAEKDCLITSEQLKNLDGQIRQLTEELAAKKKEYEDAAEKLPAGLRKLDLPRLAGELEKMNATGAEKLKALDEWEEKMEELKSSLLKAGEQLSAYRAEEKGILAELKVNRENRAQVENELQEHCRHTRDAAALPPLSGYF